MPDKVCVVVGARAGLGLSISQRFGQEGYAIALIATGLSALAKATMVCAIANSACVFFEHQSLVAAGETDKLLTKAGNFLFGVSGSHAMQKEIDMKLSQAKKLIASVS